MKSSVWPLALILVCAGVLGAQEAYTGPRPPKPDVPYLLHADNLIPTEAGEAQETQKGKNETIYTISGATSPARTPLAEPIFLLQSEKLSPDSLQLFRLESRNGRREVVFSAKKGGSRPLRLTVTRLDQGLYRIEVNENLGLENGEYSLSPKDSNQVFCFTVY